MLKEKELKDKIENFLMTTGYNFEEYKIIRYNKSHLCRNCYGNWFF